MTYETSSERNIQISVLAVPSSSEQALYNQRQQQSQYYSKRKQIQKVFETTVTTIMNAAVTIFGVGVGVGLILGDSFRGRERMGNVTVTTTTTTSTTRVRDISNNYGGLESDGGDAGIENGIGSESGSSRIFNNESLLPPQ